MLFRAIDTAFLYMILDLLFYKYFYLTKVSQVKIHKRDLT